MDLGIRGKKAIVAGGSAGLGKGSARALAREGVELVISARGEARLLAAAEEMARETGAKVTPVQADHSTRQGREKVLSVCPEPDILVMTCTPPKVTDDFRKIEEADWYESLAVTLLAPIEFMRATIDGMVSRGFGRIVNIGTGAAKYPTEIRLLSGPPRSALCNYIGAVSRKVAKHNVIINNLLPGMFHTPTIHERFMQSAAENGTSYDQEVQKFVDSWKIPAGRFGDADDFGALCAMFCSQYANFTVGQSLVIDGGLINALF